ncbi:MAG: response regulator [Candidatus Muiribacteriota bacterium]
MKKNLYILIICFLFFINIFASANHKNILFLNSFHHGYAWSDNIVDSAVKTLNNNLKNSEIYIEYMDKKRFKSEDFSINFKKYLKTKYPKDNFDLIIASDNDALNFLINYRTNIFGDVPVVFCGVNDFKNGDLADKSNFTGYVQKADVKDIILTALNFHSNIETVHVISDSTATGMAQRHSVKDVEDNFPELNFIYLNGDDFSNNELLKKVSEVKNNSIVLITVWQRDKNGEYIPFEKFYPELSDKSNAPLYGLADAWLGYGIIGGNLNSGRIQGWEAAKIGIQIINSGINASEIPVFFEKPDYYQFDAYELRRWGISSSELPRNSTVINKEVFTYKYYQNIIIIITVIIIILILLLGFLIFNIATRKKLLKAIVEAKNRAQRADELKTAFLANISHELRTPMTAIMGFTEIMESVNTKEEKNNYLNRIKIASNHLLYLLNDLIDISRIESNNTNIELAVYDVYDILEEVKKTFPVQYINKNIQFIYEKGERGKNYVYTDKARLKQIIFNFLSNSFKFTHKGYVKLGYFRDNNNNIKIFVKDSGKGIDEKNKRVIFKRFTQGEETYSKRYQGLGIGLSIARKLADFLKVKIDFESEKNKGSCFIVELESTEKCPLSPAENLDKKDFSLKNKNIKVLVVDDNEESLEVSELFLKEKGYTTYGCDSGRKALEFIENNKNIDLILLDIQMPQMDGLETFEKLQKLKQKFKLKLKVIALTAYAADYNRDNLIKKGFDSFLSKPFSIRGMENVIKELL